MRQAGEQLLVQARAILAAYPDAAALQGLPVHPLSADGTGWPALAAALRYLRQEMLLVRAGQAGGVGVLADEIAFTERQLTCG
jgi:hypothetical protein